MKLLLATVRGVIRQCSIMMTECAAYLQIASWVAQASFEPLGLTVAVAKDRAIESLLQVRPVPAGQYPGVQP